MRASTLVVVALLAIVAIADDAAGPGVGTFAPSDFVKQPTVAAANSKNGGSNDKRMVAQWPALDGMGISQTVFTMEPCALRPPHTHMYASGLLYVISASNLSVGFSLQNGTGYNNMVSTGQSTLFPQGLVHFQQNLGCDVATYTISYNSADPGTQLVIPGLLGLPASVVTASLGNPSLSAITSTANATATFIANSDAACVARCAMAPASGVTAAAGR